MIDSSSNTRSMNGFYMGQVVKHCDNGLCKVWIPGVYKDEYRYKPEYLPDAEIAVGIEQGGTFGDEKIHYPNIGAIVWLFFANNDQNYPIIFAIAPGGKNANNKFAKTREGDLCEGNKLTTCCSKGNSDKDTFQKRNPVSIQCQGNSQQNRSYSGKTIDYVGRNYDEGSKYNCAAPYSHTMHTYNFLKDKFFTGAYELSCAFYVYNKSNDYKNPILVQVGNTTYDDLKFKTDNMVLSNDTLVSSKTNYFNENCLGISCILKDKVADEKAFVSQLIEMFGNGDRDAYGNHDSRKVWDNYVIYVPTHARPGAQTTAKKKRTLVDPNKLEDDANTDKTEDIQQQIKSCCGRAKQIIEDESQSALSQALEKCGGKNEVLRQYAGSTDETKLAVAYEQLQKNIQKLILAMKDDPEAAGAMLDNDEQLTAMQKRIISQLIYAMITQSSAACCSKSLNDAESNAKQKEAEQRQKAAEEKQKEDAEAEYEESIENVTAHNGIKSVFISMDGDMRHPQLEICKETYADVYLCNSTQYEVTPAMFDKAFEGEKPYYCPKALIPYGKKAIADIDKYNVNIVMVQPNRVKIENTVDKEGTQKKILENLYSESKVLHDENAKGKIKDQMYTQFVNEDKYCTIRSAPSAYVEIRNEQDLLSGSSSIKRYYATEDNKATFHKLSVVNIDSFNLKDNPYNVYGTSSYVHDISSGYKPYPNGLPLSDYVENGIEPHCCPTTKIHEISNSNFIDILQGTQQETFTSCWYPRTPNPCMTVHSNIWKDVADMKNPQQELSVEYICEKAGVDKYVDTKMYAYKDGRAKLSVWSTDDFELTLIDPKLPGTWSYIKMKREGEIVISSSQSITLDAPNIIFKGKSYTATFTDMKTKSSTIDTTAEIQHIKANTTHVGDTVIQGSEEVTVDSTIAGISFASHTHPSGSLVCPESGSINGQTGLPQ